MAAANRAASMSMERPWHYIHSIESDHAHVPTADARASFGEDEAAQPNPFLLSTQKSLPSASSLRPSRVSLVRVIVYVPLI